MSDQIAPLLDRAWSSLPNPSSWSPKQLLTTTAATTVGTLAFLHAYRDYRTFISYGPTGLPFNVFGWFIAYFPLNLIGRETRSTKPYDDPKIPFATESGYLKAGLFDKKRNGGRPKMGPHNAPQRQLSDFPSDEIKEVMIRRYSQLAEELRDRGLVKFSQSILEKRTPGMFLIGSQAEEHPVCCQTKGEFCHVHQFVDGSVHVELAPADCKKLLEANWGERLGLAGAPLVKNLVGMAIPVNFCLVYAPRTLEEIDTVMEVVKASCGFALERRDLW